MGVRAFSCTYLLFALFPYLFVRETQFDIFFPGEVWLYEQEMQICFSFLTVCLPSFPVFFSPPPFYLFMPGMRFLQRISSLEELQKCLHVRGTQKNPSIPAQCRQLECRGA